MYFFQLAFIFISAISLLAASRQVIANKKKKNYGQTEGPDVQLSQEEAKRLSAKLKKPLLCDFHLNSTDNIYASKIRLFITTNYPLFIAFHVYFLRKWSLFRWSSNV
ncbi:hypothetical protein RB195_024539 [Necator americanus]|uniref:Uncharacterized protein n=1 Tax=Necator americanus TaxID=51031 RepID=A0ABR1ENL0_NECAM